MACRMGAAKRPQRAAEVSLDQFLPEHSPLLSSAEKHSFARVEREGLKGVASARAGRHHRSRLHFCLARRHLLELSPDCFGRGLAESLLWAQEAYLEYRLSEWKRATALLQDAFLNDLRLQRHGSAELLIAHRLQILHNLLRVELRCRRLADAVRIGAATLAFIETLDPQAFATVADPWRRGWDSTPTLPAPFVAEMHRQVASDVIAAVRLMRERRDTRQLERFWSGSTPNLERTQIARWLSFSTINPLTGTWMRDAVDLLRHGPLPSSPLWCNALRDALGSRAPFRRGS